MFPFDLPTSDKRETVGGRGECAQLVNDLSLSQLPSLGFDLCAPAPWAGVTQKKKKITPVKEKLISPGCKAPQF